MVKNTFSVAKVRSDTAENELPENTIYYDEMLVDFGEVVTNEFSAIIGVPAIYFGQRQHRDWSSTSSKYTGRNLDSTPRRIFPIGLRS